MNRNKKKGFTLVELVIVIAVIAILAGVMIATFSNVVSDAQASADMQEVKSSLDATYYEFIADEGIPNVLVEVAGKVAGFKVLPDEIVDVLKTDAVSEDKVTWYDLAWNPITEVSASDKTVDKQYYKVTLVAAKDATEEENPTPAVEASVAVEMVKGTSETKKVDGTETTTYSFATVETYVLKGEITGKNGNTFIVELVTADNYADKDLTEANIGYYTFEAKAEN